MLPLKTGEVWRPQGGSFPLFHLCLIKVRAEARTKGGWNHKAKSLSLNHSLENRLYLFPREGCKGKTYSFSLLGGPDPP